MPLHLVKQSCRTIDIIVILIMDQEIGFAHFSENRHAFGGWKVNVSMTKSAFDSLLQILCNIDFGAKSKDRDRGFSRLSNVEKVLYQVLSYQASRY